MNKKLVTLLTAVAALALAGGAGAVTVSDYPAGTAANGIGGSRHNLGNLGKVIRATATSEICVFCHTPHHTNTAYNMKPLWNRSSAAPTAFTAYGTTLGGTTINNTDIGSTTLACLSCHDGVTTFDNLVNAPGKSGVTAGGADRNWDFAMPFAEAPLTATGYDHFTISGFSCNLCHNAQQISRLSIDRDLSNDHPVSVTYDAAKGGLRATNTVIASIDLTTDLAASAGTAFGGNLAQNRWAVKGYISNTATIADILRDGKVECSSCHDPHFRNLSWDEAEPTWTQNGMTGGGDGATWCGNVGEACADGQFLRRVGGNSGSGVCRTCHNK